jgi:hypothetical protein
MITKLCNYFLCEYASKIQDKWPSQRTRARVGLSAICLPKLSAPETAGTSSTSHERVLLESLMMCRM